MLAFAMKGQKINKKGSYAVICLRGFLIVSMKSLLIEKIFKSRKISM